jgi:hypothetical protein
MKQVSWFLFLQLAIMKEISFPTLEYMMDKFTYIMLGAFEQSISWSSTKPHHVPV